MHAGLIFQLKKPPLFLRLPSLLSHVPKHDFCTSFETENLDVSGAIGASGYAPSVTKCTNKLKNTELMHPLYRFQNTAC